MNSTKELSDYARFLRNGAPDAYAAFVSAFAKYTTQTVENLIQTTENLQLAQGHAQQALKLLRALEEVKNG